MKDRKINYIRNSYVLALVTLALAILAGSAMWHHGAANLKDDALQINLAGRQRLLVEQIGTLSLALAHVTEPVKRQQLQEQLAGTIDQVERSRSILLNDFGKLSNSLLTLYFEEPNAADARLSEYTEYAQALLMLSDSASLEVDRKLQFIQDSLAAMVDRLDRVVAQYQRENEQALRRSVVFDTLRTVMTLLVLLAMALFIFRPMEKRIARDHTRELQIANDLLRTSQAELQLRYDNAPDMLLSLDVQTQKVVRCNTTTAAKLGYSKEELLGMSRKDLYAPACRERAAEAFRKFIATGRIEDVELQAVCKDGSVIDVCLSATQYGDAEGKHLYSDATWRDITERKKAEVLAAKRDKQLTTFYLMGEQMLLSKDLAALMHNVAYCLFETLAVRSVLICELCSGGRSLIVRAAIGIPQHRVNRAKPNFISYNSLPGRALAAGRPLYMSGQNSPDWLNGMDYLGNGNLQSGVATVLRDSEGDFGLIMAFHDGAEAFSQEDIDYIQSLATLLAVAAERVPLRGLPHARHVS